MFVLVLAILLGSSLINGMDYGSATEHEYDTYHESDKDHESETDSEECCGCWSLRGKKSNKHKEHGRGREIELERQPHRGHHYGTGPEDQPSSSQFQPLSLKGTFNINLVIILKIF